MKRLLRAGTWVFAGMMLGRLAGFAREVVLGSRVGATSEADVAVVLLTIPDLVLNILIGGAFGAALVPEFTRLGGRPAKRLMMRAGVLTACLAALASVALAAFALPLVRVLAPGIREEGAHAAVGHARVLLISIPFSAVTAVLAAFLHSARKFATPSMGTLVYNLVLVGALAFLASPLWGLTVGVIFGSVVRLGLHAWGARRAELAPANQDEPSSSQGIAVRYAQALAAGSVLLAYPIVARSFASLGDAGGVSVVNYAAKLIELPNGIALTVFAVVLFPTLSLAMAEQRMSDADDSARRALRMVGWLAVPLAIGLAVFGTDFATVALMRGRLDADAARRVGNATSLWAVSLPAQGASSVLVALLNARKDTRSSLLSSVAGLAVLVALCFLLQRPLGTAGVVAAIAAAYWTAVISQAWALRQHGHRLYRPGVGWQTLRSVGIAALGFAPAVLLARATAPRQAAARLAIACLGGIFALALSSGALGSDRDRLLGLVRRRNVT